ncbi:MAG: hypothetical protein ACT4PL_11410 [Phycisphaerales bacterium]
MARSMMRRTAAMATGVLGLLSMAAPVAGQIGPESVLETLSTLTVEPCLGPCLCAIGPLVGALNGSFEVRLVAIGNVFDFYTIDNVNLLGTVANQLNTLTGSGTYRHSTVANLHSIELDLSINGASPVRFESQDGTIGERSLPFLDIGARTAVLGCTRYTIGIRSRPSCAADFDRNGLVTPDDLDDYITAYFTGAHTPELDIDSNGVVNGDDLSDFITRFFDGC